MYIEPTGLTTAIGGLIALAGITSIVLEDRLTNTAKCILAGMTCSFIVFIVLSSSTKASPECAGYEGGKYQECRAYYEEKRNALRTHTDI